MSTVARQLPLFGDIDEPGLLPGFAVRESNRARRLSIRVFPRGRVEVVVPRRTRAAVVQAFVEDNKAWIEQSRKAFAAQLPPEPFMLPNRIALPAIGKVYKVQYLRKSDARSVAYRCHDDTLVLSGCTGDDQQCVAALKRWLASTARKEFAPRLRELSQISGNPYKRMQVRGQRTCWGSHSSSGTISINYCLLFLEPALLRYLMIHELCHARHMNHSRRFWERVRKSEPDYRRLDRTLGDSWKAVPVWLGMY